MVKLLKYWETFSDYWDNLRDAKHALGLITYFILGLIPSFGFLAKYNLPYEHGFFSMVGQVLIYIARYNFPNSFLFDKVIEKPVKTETLRFFGNLILSFTFGLFLTSTCVNYFKVPELSAKVVGISIMIGAFFEWILKPLLKSVFRVSQASSNYVSEKIKKAFPTDK